MYVSLWFEQLETEQSLKSKKLLSVHLVYMITSFANNKKLFKLTLPTFTLLGYFGRGIL